MGGVAKAQRKQVQNTHSIGAKSCKAQYYYLEHA